VLPAKATLPDAGVLTSAIGHIVLAGGGGTDERQLGFARNYLLMPILAVLVGCFVAIARPESVSCSGRAEDLGFSRRPTEVSNRESERREISPWIVSKESSKMQSRGGQASASEVSNSCGIGLERLVERGAVGTWSGRHGSAVAGLSAGAINSGGTGMGGA
jgi:hypothetical protein